MAFKRFVFLFLLVVSSMFLRVEIARAQVYSLQTNVLGWGTTNMNLEFGLKFSHRWTFHFPLQYNPFSFGDARLRNLSASPGIRYWVREALIFSESREWVPCIMSVVFWVVNIVTKATALAVDFLLDITVLFLPIGI